MDSNGYPDRRTFLATVGAASAVGMIRPTVRLSARPTDWDMSWLDRLKGKHKQVFDTGTVDNPLRAVANYLDAMEEIYHLRHPDVNMVVGIAGKAFPINANDALWAAWKLGERYKIQDPDTGAPAVRNIFYDRPPKTIRPVDTVKALQARGTIFWMCNNALSHISHTYADESKRPFEDVRQEIIAGFNPGVILVPAHTLLLGLCQERGCSYQVI
jgi:hypothetical protein